MTFIKANLESGDVDITLNVFQIVAIGQQDRKAIIYTNIPSKDGPTIFRLADDYAYIVEKISLAIEEPIN